MSSNPPWLVAAGDTAAREYADTLGLPVVGTRPDHGFFLVRADNGLTLYHANAGEHDPGLRLSFIDGSIERRRASGRNSPLARALGLRRHPNSRVLDTTCGLGRDSATLAALGCQVSALERHPVLFALVDEALARARAYETAPTWLEFWSCLEHADARLWLQEQASARFDVIYIDPMFTSPRRKARPQKALAWLNELVGLDSDASGLLRVARNRALRQTVVKQHARAPPLALPDRHVTGKSVRFDIYLS